MVRVVVEDPEFGEVTRDEFRPVTTIFDEGCKKGYTAVRSEGGGVELTENGGSFGESGVPQGTVVTNTGEPCNRCPSLTTDTISTGASEYPPANPGSDQQPGGGQGTP